MTSIFGNEGMFPGGDSLPHEPIHFPSAGGQFEERDNMGLPMDEGETNIAAQSAELPRVMHVPDLVDQPEGWGRFDLRPAGEREVIRRGMLGKASITDVMRHPSAGRS